jgi:hypothetical protein
MRTIVPLQSGLVKDKGSRKLPPASGPIPFVGVLAASAVVFAGQLLLGSHPAAAQTPAATPAPHSTSGQASTRARKTAHPRKRPGATPPPAAQAETVYAPLPPPPPIWPANDLAVQAAVVWDSQGLRIDARNSSLQQILNDFSAATGAKVEGMATDERVYGSFGPGQARDVLSQLLQGSSYNVLMIGDQGEGTPRQIVLSVRTAGSAQPAPVNTPSDDDADEEPPQQPQGPPPPFRAGFPPRGPQAGQQPNSQ